MEAGGYKSTTTGKAVATEKDAKSEFMKSRSVCDVYPIQYPGSDDSEE